MFLSWCNFLPYFNLLSSILLNPSSCLQTLQKIHLADHIRWMTDLLHADSIQQLEVALLRSPVVKVIDFLSGGLVQARPVTVAASAQPHPHTYTSMPPAPPVTSVPVVGITEFSHVPVVPTIESKSNEETTPPKTMTSDVSVLISKCHWVTTTLISPLVSAMVSTSSISFPVVVVPKLEFPVEAYPEYLNRPGGGKDYPCHLCHFTHSNLDSILTYIRKHLDVTIGCPICGRNYQNVASLCKHGNNVYSIQIVPPLLPCKMSLSPKRKS